MLYCTHTRCRSKGAPGPTRHLPIFAQYHQNLTWANLQKSWIHTCILLPRTYRVFRVSALLFTGGGEVLNQKCASPTSSAKKCSCLEGGGVISKKVLQVAHISIMHCSLPVISLLTCCQKEVLESCICLYSQATRHSGILPPPPLQA